MKISVTGVPMHYDFNDRLMGYPNASYNFIKYLKKEGVDVQINDTSAKINICYCDPGMFNYYINPNQYNIGYAAHESTEVKEEWKNNLNSMDEIWSTSTWTKEVFDKYINKKSFVITPGISSIFRPIRRRINNQFVFLHIGDPYKRKNADIVLKAFLKEFKNNEKVLLIFKTYEYYQIKIPDDANNIIIYNKNIDRKQYIRLLHKANCLVYPTMGEGFGFMPLEAMATGMPVISTWEWAEYKKFIHLKINSNLSDSPEYIKNDSLSEHMVGQVYLPEMESVRKNMREIFENYQKYEKKYFDQSMEIHEEYNWEKIIKKICIPRLEELDRSL